MEKGTIEIRFIDTNKTITMNHVFSYIKKKDVDNRDMMLISIKDLNHFDCMNEYNDLIEVKGKTLSNKKYPDGCYYTCSSCSITRAQKRLGYNEYLFICNTDVIEE